MSAASDNEEERIRKAYEQRITDGSSSRQAVYSVYNKKAFEERCRVFEKILRRRFADTSKINFLEIGAGGGHNLGFFHSLGIPWANIHANELLADRVTEIRKNCPGAVVHDGNAMDMKGAFDVVFQSTVFTSILDVAIKKQLAEKMWALLRPGGVILWYDFQYDNPNNRNVKGIGRGEVRDLFNKAARSEFHKVTLAPPVGRRFQRAYGFLNMFPFLRTHLVAAIYK